MRRLLILLFVTTFSLPGICQAQDINTQLHFEDIMSFAEGKKNSEKLLVNGHAYVNSYKRALGHPFFLDNTFLTGEVVYSGLRFYNQNIKYNSYEQELVLKLEMDKFGWEIVLPIERVDEFTLGNHLFRKFSLPETGSAYYQVVAETDQLTCLYFWTKPRVESDHIEGYLSYKFADDKEKKYLLQDDSPAVFRNNRSFVRLFPKDIRNTVSTYLKENKINLKSISIKGMEDLIQFCQFRLEQSESYL